MSDIVDYSDMKRRLDGAINSFNADLGGLRTARASSSLLDPIQVEAYGSSMPLNQVATISVPEPRMIAVNVWDKAMVGAVEKAIRQSGLGLNPIIDGTNLRLPLPDLTEERRKELVKLANGYLENGKIAMRHVRRDNMDFIKMAQKEGDISEDDLRRESDAIQKLTDTYVEKLDAIFAEKEKEIMQV